MWLRISFFEHRPSVLAVVGSDGKIYFKASDWGKFLGYSSIYSFAMRYSSKRLDQVVPNRIRYVSNFWIMDFQEVIVALNKCLKHSSFSNESIEKLHALWLDGYLLPPEDVSKYLPVTPRFAFEINVLPVEKENAIRLQNWIQMYAAMCLKLYERNCDDSFTKSQDCNEMSLNTSPFNSNLPDDGSIFEIKFNGFKSIPSEIHLKRHKGEKVVYVLEKK